MASLFLIDGFYKDDKSEFTEYLVCSFDSTPEGMNDDAIFYYGLSEQSIIDAINNPEDADTLDFTITSYKAYGNQETKEG